MSIGITARHRKTCPGERDDGKCCNPPQQADVWDKRTGKRIRKTFPTKSAAKRWRQDALVALRVGTMSAPSATKVEQAGAALVAGMRSGAIVGRSGTRYKPSTIRSYERALRLRINPTLGHRRVSDLTRRDVQALVEDMNGAGAEPSTVLNALDPLRVIMRRSVRNGERVTDPTDGLDLPRPRGRRERVAAREEAAALISSLPDGQQALWAAAFYGGLRRGELRALRWSDVDLASQPAEIRVRRTWDDYEAEVDAKSEAALRTVPLTGKLRTCIVEHGLRTRRGGDDLVFGRTDALPFVPSTVGNRARKAWKAAGLTRLTPHEARHCAASYLIEAGLDDLQLTATIGHSDSRTTKRIYGHLFPDSSATIAAKLDAYLAG